jgi:hypothetical protein
VGDGERADDLSGPGIRRWRQSLFVNFTDTINTVEEYGPADYAATVDSPGSGDFSSGDGDGDGVVIEYIAPLS